MSKDYDELVDQALESWEIFKTTGEINDAMELNHDLDALEKYNEEERENE